MALAESAEDEQSWDARLTCATGNDLEPFSVALKGETLDVFVVEGYSPPSHDNLAGYHAPVGEPHPLEGLFAEKLLRPPLNPADPLLIEQCSVLR